jgi:hypothetical protein
VLEVRVAPEAWPLDAAPGSAPERREDEALATDEAYGLDDAEEEGVDMVGGRILYTTFFLITIHGPTRFICASANAIFLFAAPANKSGVSGSFCKKIGLGYPETPDLFARPIFLRATKKRLDCLSLHSITMTLHKSKNHLWHTCLPCPSRPVIWLPVASSL